MIACSDGMGWELSLCEGVGGWWPCWSDFGDGEWAMCQPKKPNKRSVTPLEPPSADDILNFVMTQYDAIPLLDGLALCLFKW